MSKRKLLAVFLLLIMTVTLTAGCSQAEQGFLSLQKELTELNTSETSGDFVLTLNGLPVPPANGAAEALLYSMLQKGITVKYTGKVDLEKNIMDYTFFFVNGITGTEQEILRLICKDDVLYLKVDELIKLAQALEDTETSNKLKEVFGDTEYLSMTQEEYFQALGETQEQPLTKFNQNGFMNNKLTKVMQKLMLSLPEAYQNYNSGLVVQNGDTYSWEVTGPQAMELLGDFLGYSLNNIKDLEKWANSFLDNLSNEEMAVLGLNPQQKPLYKTMLNMATTQLSENKAEYLQEIRNFKNELQQKEEIKKVLDGLKMGCSLSKNEQGVYTSASNFEMNFQEENLHLNLKMNAKAQAKKTAPFNVTIPTAKVMTYTEYLNKVTKTIEIQVDTNAYTLKEAKGNSQDSLEVKNIENQTYLPMRKIAKLFGEEVGWDAENSQAYVLRNGEKINMTGVVIDGQTYIKTRDFTKLDYQVGWNESTRTIIISTSKL